MNLGFVSGYGLGMSHQKGSDGFYPQGMIEERPRAYPSKLEGGQFKEHGAELAYKSELKKSHAALGNMMSKKRTNLAVKQNIYQANNQNIQEVEVSSYEDSSSKKKKKNKKKKKIVNGC